MIKFINTIKSKRFLYALLYGLFILTYMKGSLIVIELIIPWRGLCALVWFICFVIVLFKSGIAYANLIE